MNNFDDFYLILVSSPNAAEIQKTVMKAKDAGENFNEQMLCLFLAECALQLISQRWKNETKPNILQKYISDFISDKKEAKIIIQKYPDYFFSHYQYIAGENTLGLLFCSLAEIQPVNSDTYTKISVNIAKLNYRLQRPF